MLLLHQRLHDHVREDGILLGVERGRLERLTVYDCLVELVQLEHVRIGVRRPDDLLRVVSVGLLRLDRELDGEAFDVWP